jgi:hypothetical protein
MPAAFSSTMDQFADQHCCSSSEHCSWYFITTHGEATMFSSGWWFGTMEFYIG